MENSILQVFFARKFFLMLLNHNNDLVQSYLDSVIWFLLAHKLQNIFENILLPRRFRFIGDTNVCIEFSAFQHNLQ